MLGGYKDKIGDRDLTISPYTQGIMEAFENWQIALVTEHAMKIAATYRKQARSIRRELGAIREDGIENVTTWTKERKAKAQNDFEELNLEMLALETDGRRIIEDIAKDAAKGIYGFYGQHCTGARASTDGVEYLFMLCASPKMDLDDVKALSKDHYGTMMMALARANGEEPKNEKPEASTPGSSTQTTDASGNQSTQTPGAKVNEAA